MKKIFIIFPLFIICQSCFLRGNQKKYFITLYRDQFEPDLNKRMPHNIIDSIKEDNDTAAYSAALKRFYDQKIMERKLANYGEPKSFIITDKNGVDLSVKLSKNLIAELRKQATSVPEVSKMLDAYKRDTARSK